MPDSSNNPTVAGIGASVVRTVVPLVVGALLTAALKLGVHLDDGAITQTVTVIVTVVFYAIVRVLETKIGPAWGWLLGVAKVPAYPQVTNATAVEAPAGGAPPFGD